MQLLVRDSQTYTIFNVSEKKIYSHEKEQWRVTVVALICK